MKFRKSAQKTIIKKLIKISRIDTPSICMKNDQFVWRCVNMRFFFKLFFLSRNQRKTNFLWISVFRAPFSRYAWKVQNYSSLIVFVCKNELLIQWDEHSQLLDNCICRCNSLRSLSTYKTDGWNWKFWQSIQLISAALVLLPDVSGRFEKSKIWWWSVYCPPFFFSPIFPFY